MEFTGFYRVFELASFLTSSYRVDESPLLFVWPSIWFKWVGLGWTRFYWVPLGSSGFVFLLLGFSCIEWVFSASWQFLGRKKIGRIWYSWNDRVSCFDGLIGWTWPSIKSDPSTDAWFGRRCNWMLPPTQNGNEIERQNSVKNKKLGNACDSVVAHPAHRRKRGTPKILLRCSSRCREIDDAIVAVALAETSSEPTVGGSIHRVGGWVGGWVVEGAWPPFIWTRLSHLVP